MKIMLYTAIKQHLETHQESGIIVSPKCYECAYFYKVDMHEFTGLCEFLGLYCDDMTRLLKDY